MVKEMLEFMAYSTMGFGFIAGICALAYVVGKIQKHVDMFQNLAWLRK